MKAATQYFCSVLQLVLRPLVVTSMALLPLELLSLVMLPLTRLLLGLLPLALVLLTLLILALLILALLSLMLLPLMLLPLILLPLMRLPLVLLSLMLLLTLPLFRTCKRMRVLQRAAKMFRSRETRLMSQQEQSAQELLHCRQRRSLRAVPLLPFPASASGSAKSAAGRSFLTPVLSR